MLASGARDGYIGPPKALELLGTHPVHLVLLDYKMLGWMAEQLPER